MRLANLPPTLALCVALASPLPVAANVSFDTTEEEDAVDSINNPQAITLADVDGDNLDDAIVAEGFDVVTVFKHEEPGVFDFGESFDTVGEGPIAVATGRFDADDFIDIVTVNNISQTVSVLLNDGDGFFDLDDPRQFQVGENPKAIAVTDLNNDTVEDLAVLSPNLIYLLQGNGDGTFSTFNPATVPTRSTDSYSIAAGLINADGNVDLVVTNRGSSSVVTFLGGGDGGLTFGAQLSAGDAPTGIVIADADNDGDNDLIVIDSEGLLTTELSLLRNDGQGGFDAPDKFTGPEESAAITALDVEPDGKVDLAVTSRFDDQIFLLCQPSDKCVNSSSFPLEAGIWRSAIGGTIPGCQLGGQVAIASGKLNGDDMDDLVALRGDLTTLCVMLNTSVPADTPTPSTTSTPSITATPSVTPTGTLSPLMTPTPTRTSTPSATLTPTGTLLPSVTPTGTLHPSLTPTPMITSTPVVTVTPTQTPISTATSVATATMASGSGGGGGGCSMGSGSNSRGSLLLMALGLVTFAWRRQTHGHSRQG